MMFIKDAPNSHGFVDAHVIEKKWKDHFEYLYNEEKDFIMPITIHPDVSGRPRKWSTLQLQFLKAFQGNTGSLIFSKLTIRRVNDAGAIHQVCKRARRGEVGDHGGNGTRLQREERATCGGEDA